MREIKSLLEQYLKVVESKQNQDNKKYWENADEPYLTERWRGRSLRKENTPFTMAMDISGYSRILNINCMDYYTDAEDQLYNQLRYALWEFEHLKCHRYFEKTVFISLGSIFEITMFGAKGNYLKDQAPWHDEKNPLFKEKKDLLKVKPFDFYESGLCSKAHHFYETMKRLTEGYDIEVMFPVTLRSPFSIAIMLRGFSELLIDIYDDPKFFNDLLGIITNYLKQFAQKRAGFLGQPMPNCYIFNDETATPTISNRIYQDLILPYEIELGNFSGGVRYWHSCGITTELYESISTIPGLRMMHIGPWSDIKKAVKVFSQKDIALEICLNSIKDIYESNEEEMRQKLQSIKNICDGKIRYSVRADGFAILHSVEFCLEKIRLWNKIGKEVFPG